MRSVTLNRLQLAQIGKCGAWKD